MRLSIKSNYSNNLVRNIISIIFVLTFALIWVISPYAEINCVSGNCTVKLGKEILNTFIIDDIESCKTSTFTHRKCSYSSSSKNCRDNIYYYPVIYLVDGSVIHNKRFDCGSLSKVSDFCT